MSASGQDGPRTPAGRPKDPAKRAAILAAARAQFFARGLEAVGIDSVATAAGVSRMTVYGHFGDKQALFAAVIEAESARVAGALGRLCCRPADAGGLAELRTDLEQFGRDLLAFLGDPGTRAFNHLLELEAPRHPDLARAFAERGPAAVARALAARLAASAAAGDLAVPDPRKAARHLLGLLRSIETAATALGLAPPPGAEAVAEHVAECVALFLRGYAVTPAGAT